MTGIRARPPWPGPYPRVEHHPELPNPVFCHECTDERARRTILPLGPDGWQWTGDESIAPSIHCHTCGCHGWWRTGEWAPA